MNNLRCTQTKPTILIADDDDLLRSAVSMALFSAGYNVVEARDGVETMKAAAGRHVAMVLLDVNMPGVNGWQALTQLRADGYAMPIIMLTGQNTIEDRVRGLDNGADDYLCKPFDLRELVSRVRAVLRRGPRKRGSAAVLKFGPTVISLADRSATFAGEPVHLTRTEYAILEYFAEHAGELITREQMLEGVWGYTRQLNTRTVDTHVWRLRQKLKDDGLQPRWIQTVAAGDGYRLVPDKQLTA